MSEIPSIPHDLEEKAHNLLKNCSVDTWHRSATKLLNDSQEFNWAIACSGGADSIFALILVYEAFPENRSNLSVFHYNHRLRGEDSEIDQNFVKKISSHLNLKFITKNSYRTSKKDEATLRDQRLRFLSNSMIKTSSKILIQGHNLDDIAETMLWRMPRGVGVEGLSAPRPVYSFENFHFVRPFLTFPRDVIRKNLEISGIPWREDASNNECQYLRNRLRMNTLSSWKQDSDRDLLNGIANTRELIEEQDDALHKLAESAYIECKKEDRIQISKLLKEPKGIARKVLTFWISREFSRDLVHHYHLSDILNYIYNKKSFKIQISPELMIKASGNFLICQKNSTKEHHWFAQCLPFGSRLFLPNGHFIKSEKILLLPDLRSEILSGNINQNQNAFIRDDLPERRLLVRTRRKGDKFHPMGAKGKRKVKDCMIDKKWNQFKKNTTPLITDSGNDILWIPGFPPSNSSRISARDDRVIRLTYTKTGS